MVSHVLFSGVRNLVFNLQTQVLRRFFNMSIHYCHFTVKFSSKKKICLYLQVFTILEVLFEFVSNFNFHISIQFQQFNKIFNCSFSETLSLSRQPTNANFERFRFYFTKFLSLTHCRWHNKRFLSEKCVKSSSDFFICMYIFSAL